MSDPVLDKLCVNTIRCLCLDAIDKAKSGHPGAPLRAAPLVFALWDRFLKQNPVDPFWPDRVRFILSALEFWDYMRPSIRLVAWMKLCLIFIFTHDTIGVGEDGHIHQTAEQVMSLRAIPNLVAEAGTSLGWERYVGLLGISHGINRFRLSAHDEKVYQAMSLTTQKAVEAALKLTKGG
ncbi:MAG TPA: hypothetical protein VLH15_04625 [Dehalococcoidales bacterium]|nr:hypothetical protein [Dehalococcoidales bacterium]